MPFDLLIQNTASLQEFIISGLKDSSQSPRSYLFEDFKMPEGAQEGEYLCLLFRNGRKDVVYELNDVLLETTAKTGEGDIKVKYLRPEIFIMKYGIITRPYLSKDKDVQYYYKKK